MINVVLDQLQLEIQISSLHDVLERAANRHLGFDSDFLNFLQRYKAYKNAQAEYKSYEHWLTRRNPERLALEMKCGYDSKDAYSLLRLLRMCREILETGKVNVSREGIDADELRDLRHNGSWKYEDLISWAEAEDKALDVAMQVSTLPKSPNRKLIGDTLTEVTFEYLSNSPVVYAVPENIIEKPTAVVTPVATRMIYVAEDEFGKLQESLCLDGWERTSEPDFNFYQDVMDGGGGPDQDVVFSKGGKSMIITTDHTLRAVKEIKKG
jgi:hypothetical protein